MHEKPDRDWDCSLCEYTTRTEKYLQSHMAVKHLGFKQRKKKIPVINAKNSRPALERKQCSVCEKYVTKMTLHEKLHGSDIVKCSYCDFETKLDSYLRKHIITKHSTREKEECKVCHKFVHGMKAHMELHNSEEDTFKCQSCSFTSRHKSVLRYHMKAHTGEVFKCEHENCNHTTAIWSNMKKHVVAVHSTQ